MKFKLDRSWASQSVRIWLIDYRNGKTLVAKPMQIDFVEVDECSDLPEPTLTINDLDALELVPQIKRELAGYTLFDNKEDYESAKRVEKAMQAHIDSLKLVIDRTLK